MIEDRVKERLGLAGPSAGGDQGGLRTRPIGGQPVAAQAGERRGLVAVGREALVPLEMLAPAFGSRPKRQPHPHIGSAEHTGLGMLQELGKHAACVRVGECKCGAEVVEQAVGDRIGLGQGKQLGHAQPEPFVPRRRSNSA